MRCEFQVKVAARFGWALGALGAGPMGADRSDLWPLQVRETATRDLSRIVYRPKRKSSETRINPQTPQP